MNLVLLFAFIFNFQINEQNPTGTFIFMCNSLKHIINVPFFKTNGARYNGNSRM